jgi:leucyl/phenylalanyl-tRNA--protein transferase
MLLAAYGQGIFPMAINNGRQIAWFSPDPRALIPLDERFHIPHGLRRVLKRKRFEITFDTDFDAVIESCATAHGATWISGEILRSYRRLHHEGYAHSVEARLNGTLVGGLYGVHLQGAFFGESMFSHATDSSKVALVALVERLRTRKFLLLDTQWLTPHLSQFGTYEIAKIDYLRLLEKGLRRNCEF